MLLQILSYPGVVELKTQLLILNNILWLVSVGDDTYGITGIPTMVGRREVVERAGLGADNPQVWGIATAFKGRVFNPNLLIRHKGSQRILLSISS